MAQLDYFANTDKDTNKIYPFIVDVQDNLLGDLNSRVVIPSLSNSNISYIKYQQKSIGYKYLKL